jgi:HSP20 family protein
MLVRRNGFASAPSAGTLAPLFQEFDSVFRDFAGSGAALAHGVPPADVMETKDSLVVKVDLPGHNPESLQVKLEEGTLTITSERRIEKGAEGEAYLRRERSSGAFTRSFVLPQTVDGSKVEATFEHGVLTVTLPKREEAKPRVIDVKVHR